MWTCQEMAETLLDILGDVVAGQGCPMWVQVLDREAERRSDPDGSDEGPCIAFSDRPEGFLGWVATDDCQGVGVVATGQMRHLDDLDFDDEEWDPSFRRPDWARHEGPVELACVVRRDGTVSWTVRLPDGEVVTEPPSEGRLLDCMRRCFGLPTPPPPGDPVNLQSSAWLASILEATADVTRKLTWSEVTRLHPLARVIEGDLHPDCAHLFPGLIRVAAAAWTWGDFRAQACQEDCLEDVISPELAGWMDDGMFARWILAWLPSVDELLAAARPYLVPSAARRLAHAVHAAETALVNEPSG
jgi:hypothetical protein